MLSNREHRIMDEAFVVGRVYSSMGEVESPSVIYERLKRSCVIAATRKTPGTKDDSQVERNNIIDEELSCPNIYCPNRKNNVCKMYIGIPMDCESRDKYIKDNCPLEYEEWTTRPCSNYNSCPIKNKTLHCYTNKPCFK